MGSFIIVRASNFPATSSFVAATYQALRTNILLSLRATLNVENEFAAARPRATDGYLFVGRFFFIALIGVAVVRHPIDDIGQTCAADAAFARQRHLNSDGLQCLCYCLARRYLDGLPTAASLHFKCFAALVHVGIEAFEVYGAFRPSLGLCCTNNGIHEAAWATNV